MSKKRTQYSSEFKAKVALAAIRGDETIPPVGSTLWDTSHTDQ
jgi:transposase